MRYVPSPPPTEPAASEELRPSGAVAPTRRVGPRTRPPRVIQRFRHRAGKGGAAAAETPAPRPERRGGQDRRVLCRRLRRDVQPFLDTRSGAERRRRRRRSGDAATTLDEEG